MNETRQLNVITNVVTGVSKKTGNPYTMLETVFPDGYKIVTFLNSDQVKIISTYK